MAEAFGTTNALAGIDNAKAGLAAAADIKSRHVTSLTVADGVITAVVQAIDANCDTKSIVMTPVVKDGALEWLAPPTLLARSLYQPNFRLTSRQKGRIWGRVLEIQGQVLNLKTRAPSSFPKHQSGLRAAFSALGVRSYLRDVRVRS
ncbi:MAG: hypothetical protein IPN37_02665 [Betaproteobacteria bacterium]|nr:hypothetical protein [Betaproteobacteria bacterium]